MQEPIAKLKTKSVSLSIKEGLMEIYHRIFQKILLAISHFLMFLLTRTKIYGKSNIAGITKGPLLIVANHKSALDPLLIGLCFPFFSKVYPLRFIAKDELFEKWYSRFIFVLLGAYPAYKGQGLEKSLSIPTKVLAEGGTVVFFPEGARIREDNLGKGKIGAAVLATRFPEIPIVPVAIYNTPEIGRWGLLYKRPKINLIIGQPFCLNEKYSGVMAEEVIEILMEKINNLYKKILNN